MISETYHPLFFQAIVRQRLGPRLQPEVHQGDAVLDRSPASPSPAASRRDLALHTDGAHQAADGPPPDVRTLTSPDGSSQRMILLELEAVLRAERISWAKHLFQISDGHVCLLFCPVPVDNAPSSYSCRIWKQAWKGCYFNFGRA